MRTITWPITQEDLQEETLDLFGSHIQQRLNQLPPLIEPANVVETEPEMHPTPAKTVDTAAALLTEIHYKPIRIKPPDGFDELPGITKTDTVVMNTAVKSIAQYGLASRFAQHMVLDKALVGERIIRYFVTNDKFVGVFEVIVEESRSLRAKYLYVGLKKEMIDRVNKVLEKAARRQKPEESTESTAAETLAAEHPVQNTTATGVARGRRKDKTNKQYHTTGDKEAKPVKTVSAKEKAEEQGQTAEKTRLKERRPGELHPAEIEWFMETHRMLDSIALIEQRRRFVSLFTHAISVLEFFAFPYLAEAHTDVIKTVEKDIQNTISRLGVNNTATKRWILDNQERINKDIFSEIRIPFGISYPLGTFIIDNRSGNLVNLLNTLDESHNLFRALREISGLTSEQIRSMAIQINELIHTPLMDTQAPHTKKKVLAIQGYQRVTPMPADNLSEGTLLQQARDSVQNPFVSKCRQIISSEEEPIYLPGTSAVHEIKVPIAEGKKREKDYIKAKTKLLNEGITMDELPGILAILRKYYQGQAEYEEAVIRTTAEDIMQGLRAQATVYVVPVVNSYASSVSRKVQAYLEQSGFAEEYTVAETGNLQFEYTPQAYSAIDVYIGRYNESAAHAFIGGISPLVNEDGLEGDKAIAETVKKVIQNKDLFQKLVIEGSAEIGGITIDRKIYDDHMAQAIFNKDVLGMFFGIEAIQAITQVCGIDTMNNDTYYAMWYDFELLASMFKPHRFWNMVIKDSNQKLAPYEKFIDDFKSVFSVVPEKPDDEKDLRQFELRKAGQRALLELQEKRFHREIIGPSSHSEAREADSFARREINPLLKDIKRIQQREVNDKKFSSSTKFL